MVTKPKASFSGDSGDSRNPGPCSKGQSEHPAASSVCSHCIYRTACSWSRGSGRKLESVRSDFFRPLITSHTGSTQPGLFCFVFLFSHQVRQRHTCAQWSLNRMCWAAKCHQRSPKIKSKHRRGARTDTRAPYFAATSPSVMWEREGEV